MERGRRQVTGPRRDRMTMTGPRETLRRSRRKSEGEVVSTNSFMKQGLQRGNVCVCVCVCHNDDDDDYFN